MTTAIHKGRDGHFNERTWSSSQLQDFSAVDTSDNPNDLIKYLERSHASPLGARNRRSLLRILQPRSGEHILDFGCGIGCMTRALARRVGRNGRVIGFDNSRAMIQECRRRAQGIGKNLEFQLGDAHHMPYPEATFDACVVMSTLIHVANPPKALAEVFRVLKLGGRLVILEPDLDTLVLDIGDTVVSDGVTKVIRANVRNSGIGHQMPLLLRNASFTVLSVGTAAQHAADFHLANDCWRIESSFKRAVAVGMFSPHAARRMLRRLRQAGEELSFFAASAGFAALAIKPCHRDNSFFKSTISPAGKSANGTN